MAFTARASVIIRAPRSGVWRALLDPETIPMIMPITKVVAPWRLGEAFVWEFELAGKPTRVDGHVHGLSDERVLEYDYVDPHSREVLGRRDVHGVRVELSGIDDAKDPATIRARLLEKTTQIRDGMKRIDGASNEVTNPGT